MKRQKSILLIDDDPSVGDILTEILSESYSEVVFISSPQQAKELIKQRAFSMIVSDVNMPELMGDQLVRYVRSFGRLEPIIFITGHATRDVLISALRLGVSDVIEKPIDPQFLLDSVTRIFEMEKRRHQIYAATALPESGELTDQDHVKRQKKIVGLLQVIGEQKKAT